MHLSDAIQARQRHIHFFCGGAAYILLELATKRFGLRAIAGITLSLAAVSWVYIWCSSALNIYVIMGIAFPLSVATLAAVGFIYPNFMRPFAALGDVSYSSYLLHFPLQICFAMTVDRMGFSRDAFYNPWMLGMFMAILIPLSFASHRLFEVPVQRLTRKAFVKHSTVISDTQLRHLH